jgi:AmmeMemoRadiSam system protein B
MAEPSVRPPLYADNRWYPASPDALRRKVGEYIASAPAVDLPGDVVGLVAPHAGYVYSGQTAGYAYRQVEGANYDAVTIVSPLHQMPLGRFATTSAAAYETPLGLVKVEKNLVSALGEKVPINQVGHDGEHSLEIQLPFLQVALGDFDLLPVMIGESSLEAGEELGVALAEVLRDKKALLVASTDLHHIRNYDEVVRRDQVVVDAFASFDMVRIKKVLSPIDCSVCGRIAVYAVLTAAKALGANEVRILQHTNSGDVTGSRVPGQYTVGYLAAAVYGG